MERQRSGHAEAHLGGIRTLTLLGGASGIAGYLWQLGYPAPATALIAGCIALIVIGYFAASRADIDATTEAATLVVAAAGFLAGLGHWALSSAIIALTAFILIEKSKLHAWSQLLPDTALRASFRFAVMALVILPLLPEGPFGPGAGVRPRELWIVVLILSGISFLGYAAHCIWGAGRGAIVAGLLGGLVSSTNTTLTFSRKSRTEAEGHTALALGALAASTVMFARVLVVASALEPHLALAALRYLLPPLAVGALLLALGLRQHQSDHSTADPPRNPLEVGAALKMALLFQAVLFALDYVRGAWGESGLVASAAVLGLTDVDALTMSMAKAASTNAPQAALALAVGCSANTVFKGGIALLIGQGPFRRWAGLGFLVLLAATLLSIGTLRP
jgi:uncharacterized membrane protein (DUF4010 family)